MDLNRDKTIRSVVTPLVISAIAAIAFYLVSRTLSSVILFIPGIIISLIIYFSTFYKTIPNPKNILPLYLLALSVQMLHFLEEYLTGFIVALPNLIGTEPYPEDSWISFNLAAYSIFILGGIIIYKKESGMMVIPIFFILIGVIFNGIAHTLLAIYTGGYFPGLYTAIIYLILGPLIIKSMFRSKKLAV